MYQAFSSTPVGPGTLLPFALLPMSLTSCSHSMFLSLVLLHRHTPDKSMQSVLRQTTSTAFSSCIQLINMYNKARKEVLTQSLARQAFSDSAFTTNPTSDKILARTNLADAAADINGSTTLLVSNKQRRESDRHTSRCLTSVCRRTTIETGLTQRESSSMPLMSVVQNEIYCCSKTRADKPPRK